MCHKNGKPVVTDRPHVHRGGNGGNNWEHGFLIFRIFEHSEGLVLDLWIF